MARVVRWLRGFGAFWWDFVVGDDWRIATGVVLTLAATAALSVTPIPAWWLLPVWVLGVLGLSLWHAIRSRS
jgi:hypothetical protein